MRFRRCRLFKWDVAYDPNDLRGAVSALADRALMYARWLECGRPRKIAAWNADVWPLWARTVVTMAARSLQADMGKDLVESQVRSAVQCCCREFGVPLASLGWNPGMGEVDTGQLLRMLEEELTEILLESVEAHVHADRDGLRQPV